MEDDARSGGCGPAPTGSPTSPEDAADEGVAAVADAVSLALVSILRTLEPADQLAFIVGELFGLPPAEAARLTDARRP
ncbi:MAG TPA: hypothetical protein VFI34_02355 [Candidatus Limnocylindrales bacterium]|nr:hypothetical protein [Candidatus Limnocylindrales bacterium]